MNIRNDKSSGTINLKIVSILIIGMMFVIFSAPIPTIEQTPQRQWHVIWKGSFVDLVTAEASPGSGVAGILEIFFVNHTSSPDLAYSTNNSGLLENWCTAAHLGYTSADDFNTELAALVNFDIVIRVRGNSTVCGEGGIYRGDYLRVNITSTAPLSTSDQYTYGIETRNVSTDPFIWMNFYINDTMPGAGDFVLDKDNSATITEIRLDAFY